jgi:hypothetical protein
MSMKKSRIATGLTIALATSAAAGGVYAANHETNKAKVVRAEEVIGKHALKGTSYEQYDITALSEAQQLTASKIKKLGVDKLFDKVTDVQLLVLDISGATSVPASDVLSNILPSTSLTALQDRGFNFEYNLPANDCLNAYMTTQDGKTEAIIPLSNR